MSELPVVVAAGGVLWRGHGPGTQIAVVHRPRYDDWSLPKGKRKSGEPLVLTALREVEEETGHQPVLGRYLAGFSYPTTSGGRAVRKDVAYWAMAAGPGAFVPNDEIDEVRWMSVPDAAATVDSAVDRRLLRLFAVTPRSARPLLIIRSGGPPAPVSLAAVVTGLGITALRCGPGRTARATLEPVAVATGLALVTDDIVGKDPAAAADLLVSHDGPGGTAVCLGQARVTALLGAVAARCGLAPPPPAPPAGGWQLLQLACGRLLPADAAGSGA